MENENGLMTIDKESGEMVPVETTKLPSQARDDAVSLIISDAISRATSLELTDNQIAALKADFPDEAFRTGAAGKENLIYIEHLHLRNRLDEAFGMGKWALIRILPFRVEDFKTSKGDPAHRIYATCALIVNKVFVAEATGDGTYYETNDSMNYGDAAEAAITQALRRCAKQFGIGLQAWSKTWCEGWMSRNKGHRPAAQQSQPAPQPQAEAKTAPVTPNRKLEELIITIGNMDALAMAAITTPKEVWRATQESWVNEFGKGNLGRLQKAVAARGTALKAAKPPVVEEAHFEEVDPTDSTPSLLAALDEPELPVPTTKDEWLDLICSTMTTVGLEKVEAMVKQHVILNGKMTGAAKKPITDCLKDQKSAIYGEAV